MRSTDNTPVATIIVGAAGRDFHDFNMVYRDDPTTRVAAFTAAQIPGIDARRYPAALAGPGYPDGIAIEPQSQLEALIAAKQVRRVVFAYSDVQHSEVMHLASRALAAGADFVMLGPESTMIETSVPTIAISAVRTGCGKSQVARWVVRRARARGLRVAVLRHPMPYGDLAAQAVQRFAEPADLDRAHCTIEEREEYEPHLALGSVVYAGVDYARVVAAAQADADLIIWDGGNNDFPFVRPSLHIVLVDALRVGHESAFHPGETCLRMADLVVVAKTDSAKPESVAQVTKNVRLMNPSAPVVLGQSPIKLDRAEQVRDKRVLVIEDGPTLTHGGMAYGAGYLAAKRAGAAAIIDPRASAVGSIRACFDSYPHIGPVLPALGYSDAQLHELIETIRSSGAELVIAATPIDLAHLVQLAQPILRARYEYDEAEVASAGADTTLALALERFFESHWSASLT